MIVLLLTFSTNLLANDVDTINYSFTGERVSDNYALISYDALRIANAKMIELDYEKEINKTLKETIINDSIVISILKNDIQTIEVKYKKKLTITKTKLYAAEGCTLILAIALLVILL